MKLLLIILFPFFVSSQSKLNNFLSKPFPKNSPYTVENTLDVYSYAFLAWGCTKIIEISLPNSNNKYLKSFSGGIFFGINSAVMFERGIEGKVNGSWGTLLQAQTHLMSLAYKNTLQSDKEIQLQKVNEYINKNQL